MRVEILEERLSDTDPETGRHHLAFKGDVLTVSDACGKAWCRHGWGKDVEGNVETGERVVRGAVVEPDNAAHATSDTGEE